MAAASMACMFHDQWIGLSVSRSFTCMSVAGITIIDYFTVLQYTTTIR